MGNNDPQSGGPQFNLQPEQAYTIKRTQPDEIVRHDISDEELTTLSDTKRGGLWEAMWIALGMSAGFAETAVSAIVDSYSSDKVQPLSVGDQAQVIIFFCALVAFIILWFVHGNKRKGAKDLVDEIRKRSKQEVGSGQGSSS